MQHLPNTEARNSTRFDYRATILIENFATGKYLVAEMVNYSKKGIRFESNTAFKPGQKIVFAIENSPYESCPGVYWATIKWCRKMGEHESMYDFGMGAEYLSRMQLKTIRSIMATPSILSAASIPDSPLSGYDHPLAQYRSKIERLPAPNLQQAAQEKRRHTRKPCSLLVRYLSAEGRCKSVVKNISKGGAYLLKQSFLRTGQKLQVEFPGRKRQSTLKVDSEVAWQNGDGFGIRFKRVVPQKENP